MSQYQQVNELYFSRLSFSSNSLLLQHNHIHYSHANRQPFVHLIVTKDIYILFAIYVDQIYVLISSISSF